MLSHLPNLATAAPPAAASRSLFGYVLAGGPVGFAIIVLSIVALALVITQYIRTGRERFVHEGAEARLDKLLSRDRIKDAQGYCDMPEHDSFLTRVFGSALERCARSPFGFLEIKSALEESGREEVEQMYRRTDWIGLIATVAPMLGLLGTVIGILIAFDRISATEGVPRPGDLAGGISQALVTTVLGLLVAIPTSFAFTFLRNRIDTHAAEAARIAETLASRLEGANPTDQSKGRPVAGPARAQPAPAGAAASSGTGNGNGAPSA